MSHMRYIFELTVAHFWEHSIRTEAVPVVTCGVSIVIGFSFIDSITGSPHSCVPSGSGSRRNLSHSWATCSLSHFAHLGMSLVRFAISIFSVVGSTMPGATDMAGIAYCNLGLSEVVLRVKLY